MRVGVETVGTQGMKGKRVLVVGASSDLATALNEMLIEAGATVGLHYSSNPDALSAFTEGPNIIKLGKTLESAEDCHGLVDEFVEGAGGIDALVQLSGNFLRTEHWLEMGEDNWRYDLDTNLVHPFFLAQRAVRHMKQAGKGGRIILTSTASAAHGGGGTSMAYGAAKAAVECITKGMARDCAKDNILVNCIAPGFIKSKMHMVKMGRSEEQLRERVQLIPLKRSGTREELGGSVMFLLSEHASYITGQVIAVSGGDWL